MKAAYYFGPRRRAGHYLWTEDHNSTLEPRQVDRAFPWDIGLLDGGLLKNRGVPDAPDGRVHVVCGGRPLWFAFVWWDRSVDTRGACNSGFYVRGFGPEVITRAEVIAAAPHAFEFACETWPDVVARQAFPLVLQPLPPVDVAEVAGV